MSSNHAPAWFWSRANRKLDKLRLMGEKNIAQILGKSWAVGGSDCGDVDTEEVAKRLRLLAAQRELFPRLILYRVVTATEERMTCFNTEANAAL
jgi:hypothetical protein